MLYPRVCLSVSVSVCTVSVRAPAPRGAASPARAAPSGTSCRAARAGKGSPFLRLQNKSSGARQAPGPPHDLSLPRTQSFCPQSVCCSTCLCAAGRRRAAPRGEGLKNTGARSPVAAPPQPRARQLRVLPGRARGGRLSPAGTPDLPAGWGRGTAGAPGCPRRYREPRRGEGGEGASTAPQRALGPRSPPQELGCRSGRRLVQPRRVSPGAPGTRCASEEATPLPIFIHLLALLY